MSRFVLRHLTDRELLRNLAGLAARSRATLAEMLAHLAEVDARRLYREAAHPSLYSYCVRGLALSESTSSKIIAAVRAAREFPVICEMLAAGTLHLSGIVVLSPHLTPETASDLLSAASGRTRVEIEVLIASRRRAPLPLVDCDDTTPTIPPGAAGLRLSDSQTSPVPDRHVARMADLSTPSISSTVATPPVPPVSRASSTTPVTTEHCRANTPAQRPGHHDERSVLRIAARRSLHEKLARARVLLGHHLRSGDPADVIEKALDGLIARLERRGRHSDRPGAVRKPAFEAARDTTPRHDPTPSGPSSSAARPLVAMNVLEAGRSCPTPDVDRPGGQFLTFPGEG